MSLTFADRYSIPHVAVGALASASRVPALPTIAGLIAFEMVEDWIKANFMKSIWPDAKPDTMINRVGDVFFGILGFYGAEFVKNRGWGRKAITGTVALGAGVWTHNLFNRGYGQ